MKKHLCLLVCLVCGTILFANFSLGLSLGQPSGITAKYQFNENLALDVGLAYSFLWLFNGYYINADVVYIFPDLFFTGETFIPLYAGVGIGYLGIQGLQVIGGYLLSVRIPLGASYIFPVANGIEGFLELAPTMNITPIQSFNIAFRIGARYRF